MTSYSDAGGPANAFGQTRWQGGCSSMRWKPFEIVAIVVAFIFWWPVGLALVGLKVAQRRGFRLEDAVASLRGVFGGAASDGAARPQWRPFSAGQTGNVAFDAWRAAEMAKLEEERRKLDAAQRSFAEHLANLRHARDREEFEGFMRARDAARQTPTS